MAAQVCQEHRTLLASPQWTRLPVLGFTEVLGLGYESRNCHHCGSTVSVHAWVTVKPGLASYATAKLQEAQAKADADAIAEASKLLARVTFYGEPTPFI